MFDITELEQFTTFADTGTLSMAAEKLHISQPTITRTMQHLEEVFGVSLFVRGKNKIMLNDTGLRAVEQARQLLTAADNALKTVRAYDKVCIPLQSVPVHLLLYGMCFLHFPLHILI